MKLEEITALAREYAEEECNKSTLPDKRQLHEDKLIEFYDVYGFLLRRYCLVEKEAVRKEYEPIKDVTEDCNYKELGATWDNVPYLSRFYDEGYKRGQKDTLESLFPEIAKEVEE